MSPSEQERKKLPPGIKVAATYLIIVGALRLVGMLYAAAHTLAKTSNMSAGLFSSYIMRIGVAAMVVFAGAALFQRKHWSRRFALGTLIVVAYFAIKTGALLFVWGHSPILICVVPGMLLILTTVTFVLLLRRSAVEALPSRRDHPLAKSTETGWACREELYNIQDRPRTDPSATTPAPRGNPLDPLLNDYNYV